MQILEILNLQKKKFFIFNSSFYFADKQPETDQIFCTDQTSENTWFNEIGTLISCRQVFITLEYNLQVCECAITSSGITVILLEIKQNFININFVDEPLPIESSKINLYNKNQRYALSFHRILQKKKKCYTL